MARPGRQHESPDQGPGLACTCGEACRVYAHGGSLSERKVPMTPIDVHVFVALPPVVVFLIMWLRSDKTLDLRFRAG